MAISKEERIRRAKERQEKYSKERRVFDKAFLDLESKQLQKNSVLYDKVIKDATKNLKAFYLDYGHDSIVVFTEAIAPLANKKKILNEIKKELERVGDSPDSQYISFLKQLQTQKNISRLDGLTFEIHRNAHDLAMEANLTTQEYLTGSFEKSYMFQTAVLNELSNKTFKGSLAKTRVQKAVFAEYNAKSFSSRIWADKDKLIETLRPALSDMFIRQKHIDGAVKVLESKFEVSKSSAERIVRTEGARITEEATRQSYAEHKIERYIYDAVLDERTSDVCEDLNGQEFLLSEAVPGVNYPPMHPNCRSTTIPVFD